MRKSIRTGEVTQKRVRQNKTLNWSVDYFDENRCDIVNLNHLIKFLLKDISQRIEQNAFGVSPEAVYLRTMADAKWSLF